MEKEHIIWVIDDLRDALMACDRYKRKKKKK